MKKLTFAILLLVCLSSSTFAKNVEIRFQDFSRFEIVDNKRFYVIVYDYNKNGYVKHEFHTKAQMTAFAYVYYNGKQSSITIKVK